MSRRLHPVEEVFRQKLAQHSAETPHHLWERIERERNARTARRLRLQQRYALAALLVIGLGAGIMSWYAKIDVAPTLGSFPLPEESVLLAEACPPAAIPPPQPIAIAEPKLKPQRTLLMVTPLPETELQPVASLENNLNEAIVPELPAVSYSALNASLQMSMLPLLLREVQSAPLPMPLASGCASFTDGKFKFYFDAMAAPSMALRSLKPTDENYALYADSRRATELPRYTYGAALQLSAVYNNTWALRSGVHYSEIRERFAYTIENEVRTIITNIYGQNGTIIGTDTTIENNARQVVANNRYRTLNIPIIVGYEKNFNRFSLAINGGASINILFEPNGEFLSPEDNRPVTFSNDTRAEAAYPAFREGLGLSFYGSVGVQYYLSPRLQLLVEPHVNAFTRSFTREDFMTDQRYLTAGVFVGLRHQFQL